MRRGVPARRIIALLAAYLVAAQALLLPLTLAAGAALPGAICAASSERGPAPAGGDTGCPCAAGCGMACCVQTLAGAPQVFAVIERSFVRGAVPAPVQAPQARPPENGPHSARAPPAA
jgi:hypothetical protein